MIGVEHDRANPARRLVGGRDDRGAGAVGEQRSGIAVGDVEEPREEVGAHDQRVTRPAGLDLAAGHGERGQPAGACGANVEGAGPGCADQPGHQRRSVRGDLVGGRGRDQHQVELAGLDARVLERGASGLRRQLAQALLARRPRSLPGAGAFGDPGRIDAQPGGELVVGDEPLGKRHGHAGDRRSRFHRTSGRR
jgi:hypothetical protein